MHYHFAHVILLSDLTEVKKTSPSQAKYGKHFRFFIFCHAEIDFSLQARRERETTDEKGQIEVGKMLEWK